MSAQSVIRFSRPFRKNWITNVQRRNDEDDTHCPICSRPNDDFDFSNPPARNLGDDRERGASGRDNSSRQYHNRPRRLVLPKP